jgi:hypothetical protein
MAMIIEESKKAKIPFDEARGVDDNFDRWLEVRGHLIVQTPQKASSPYTSDLEGRSLTIESDGGAGWEASGSGRTRRVGDRRSNAGCTAWYLLVPDKNFSPRRKRSEKPVWRLAS